MRTILNRHVLSHSVASIFLDSDPSLADSMSLWSGPLLVLWLYLPGYLANTAAMLGGKWIPDLTGIPVKPIDGGKIHSDGNRILGDGKTWNGLIGGTIGGGLLGMLTHSIAGNNSVTSAPFLDPLGNYGLSSNDISDAWFWMHDW